MNTENLQVLTNIIGAVESGGQVYGKRRYNAYTAPYTNTPNEHTVTLGWQQAYGAEAKQLVQRIFDKDPAVFRKLDTCSPSIESMLRKDWVGIRWNPSASQKTVLIRLIDSSAGHQAQDELFVELMQSFIADCGREYTADVPAQMMYCEIRHLGGKSAADRIFRRCKGDYSLEKIMASLKADQEDGSSDHQVGDRIFWSRHEKCAEFIRKYAVDEGSGKEAGMTALERAKVLLRQPKWDVMTGYTPGGKQCFVDAGAWTKNPKKGDVIYFYSSAKGRVGHVGIVESVDPAAKIVHTVEGNTSSTEYAENGGCVARHSYSYASQGGTNRVNGFGRPDFKGAGVTADAFVAMAVSYLGYLEKRSNAQLDSKTANAGSNNYQKFQRDVDAGNGDQWCQYFVDAVALYTCRVEPQKEKTDVAGPTLHEDPKWTGRVTAGRLNVRIWAGAGNPTVSFSPLMKGTEIGVCDELEDAGGRKWYYVLCGGKHGFVNAKYIEKVQDTSGKAPKKISAAAVMTAAVKKVTDTARELRWSYGDSHSEVPCGDGRISCDRLIARALYDMGFRDQRLGGETCGTLDQYLTGHGWKKVTKKSEIRAGAVVAVRDRKHGYIDHVFYVTRYDKATDTCTKYDCGSDERIRTVQPYKGVKLVEWSAKVFVCAWNCPAWIGSGTPGRFVRDGVDYAPVFNAVYYRKMNPDVAKVCGTDRQKLFEHFLDNGRKEGRKGCAGG